MSLGTNSTTLLIFWASSQKENNSLHTLISYNLGLYTLKEKDGERERDIKEKEEEAKLSKTVLVISPTKDSLSLSPLKQKKVLQITPQCMGRLFSFITFASPPYNKATNK